MTKTENLGLNLMEAHDGADFRAINDNTRQTETVLLGQNEAISESARALAAAVNSIGTGGHNARVTYGTYVGDGTWGEELPKRLEFNFTPVLLIIGTASNAINTGWPAILLRDCPRGNNDCGDRAACNVTWGDNFVEIWNGSNPAYQFNRGTYYYVALGHNG